MSDNAALLAAILGQGGAAPQGAAPLSSMSQMFATNAAAMQRQNPAMPWYMVPGIFSAGGPAQPVPGAAAPAQQQPLGAAQVDPNAPQPSPYANMGPGF